jgi:raffinose/stachyose/melibiose transport system permease protein
VVDRRSFRGGYVTFLVPGLILFLLIIVFPFVMNIGISLTRWRGVGTPIPIGFENYVRLLGDATFWASFRNNVALIVAMTIIPTIVGLVLSAVLFDYIGRRFGPGLASFFRAGYYLPQILPVAVAGIVWGWIFHPRFGALNAVLEAVGLGDLARNWLGDPSTAMLSVMVVMIWFQIGYPIVIFIAGLARIDPELYEAAEIDGASWWSRLVRISIPLIQPEIFVVVLTTTIHALKVFGPIFVLTRGGPGSATVVPSYFAYQNYFEKANVGYGSAISTVLTVIIIILTLGFLRVQARQGFIGGR